MQTQSDEEQTVIKVSLIIRLFGLCLLLKACVYLVGFGYKALNDARLPNNALNYQLFGGQKDDGLSYALALVFIVICLFLYPRIHQKYLYKIANLPHALLHFTSLCAGLGLFALIAPATMDHVYDCYQYKKIITQNYLDQPLVNPNRASAYHYSGWGKQRITYPKTDLDHLPRYDADRNHLIKASVQIAIKSSLLLIALTFIHWPLFYIYQQRKRS